MNARRTLLVALPLVVLSTGCTGVQLGSPRSQPSSRQAIENPDGMSVLLAAHEEADYQLRRRGTERSHDPRCNADDTICRPRDGR